jgi:hypothetical protein
MVQHAPPIAKAPVDVAQILGSDRFEKLAECARARGFRWIDRANRIMQQISTLRLQDNIESCLTYNVPSSSLVC